METRGETAMCGNVVVFLDKMIEETERSSVAVRWKCGSYGMIWFAENVGW